MAKDATILTFENDDIGHFKGLGEAKAAAQADYDSRIRSALITETDNG